MIFALQAHNSRIQQRTKDLWVRGIELGPDFVFCFAFVLRNDIKLDTDHPIQQIRPLRHAINTVQDIGAAVVQDGLIGITVQVTLCVTAASGQDA